MNPSSISRRTGGAIVLVTTVVAAVAWWRFVRPVGDADHDGAGVSTASSATDVDSRHQQTIPAESVDPLGVPPRRGGEAIGMAACAECHADRFAEYSQTAHFAAFSEVVAEQEPADDTFTHARSGRTYEVYRKAGRLHHRESLLDEQGKPVVETDLPVKYLVGSGRHSRTYLVEVAGFLMESPITYYASRQSWGMSPGYDTPDPLGFERSADLGCLVCHLGRAERVDGALNRLSIHEQSIGCENCHGPGEHHAEFQRWDLADRADRADPIVHPGKLDRERTEAVCAQCHLRGVATVYRKGLGLNSFQPGMKLTDVRADYRVQQPEGDRMNVTGHFDQLWLSRCYTESDSLTCITCHDPHTKPDPAYAAQQFRQHCLECHQVADCGVPVADARRTDVADNCNHCHMPQVPTDIPHIAFTHHRIGIHGDVDESQPSQADDLEPLLALSNWSEHERDRALALAYLEVSPRSIGGPQFQSWALSMLRDVLRDDPHDATVASAVARIEWADQPQAAIRHAMGSLAEGADAHDRANALLVLGSLTKQWGDTLRAEQVLQELITLRRHSEDWLLLGECRIQRDKMSRGLAAVEEAERINPFRPDLHDLLSILHAHQGNTAAARRQREIVEQLVREH